MTLEEFSCSRLYMSEACRGRWAPSLTRGENHRNKSLENTEAEASGLGLCANKTFCTWNQGNMTWQGNQGNMTRGPKLLPWASVQTKYSELETVHVLTYRGCWAPSFSSRENQGNMSHKKTKGKASALGLCANKTSHRPNIDQTANRFVLGKVVIGQPSSIKCFLTVYLLITSYLFWKFYNGAIDFIWYLLTAGKQITR